MPFLSYGNYTAHVMGPESRLIETGGVAFTYYPYGLGFWSLLALIFLNPLVRWKRIDSQYRDKHYVLLPGALGLLFLYFGRNEFQFLGIPFLLSTLVLLYWRWRKVQDNFSAALTAWMLGTVLMFLLILLASDSMPFLPEILIPSVMLGMVLSLPIILTRLLIRSGKERNRRLIGLILFVLVVDGVMTFLFSLQGAPIWIFGVVLLYLALMTLPFVLLVLFNSWARDVATGALYQILLLESETVSIIHE